MTATRRSVLGLGTCAGIALLGVRKGLAQSGLTLAGEVLDKTDKAIQSVDVKVYRGNVKIGAATTDSAGRYAILFEKGAPIDAVRYERTEYNVGVINDLCGARAHSINKTLYPRGAKLTLLEGLESLSALERVFYIDTAIDVRLEAVKARYGPILFEMKTDLPVLPWGLQERHAGV